MDSLVKSFVRNSIMPISLYDRDMRLLEMSRPWKEMYQISEDKIGKSHYQTFQQQPAHWIKAHQAALNGMTLEHTEEPYKLPNGAAGWHRWQCLPWYAVDGSIAGIIISAEDITSKKDREIELEALLERFELVQQAAIIGMWDWDIVRGNITFNEEYYKILGIRTGVEFSYYDFENLILPADRDRVSDARQNAFNGHADYEVVFRIKRPIDGKISWIKDKGRYHHDADGNPVRAYGAIQDITEHKVLQDQKLYSGNKQEVDFLDVIAAGVCSCDCNGVIIYSNQVYADMVGYTLDEIMGCSVYSLVSKSYVKILNGKLSDRMMGKPETYEIYLVHKNGSEVRALIAAKPVVQNGELIGTIGTFIELGAKD